MNILIATSEAVPFAKTGGLADVASALPKALAKLGHRAHLILPAYRQASFCGQPIEPMGIDFIVPVGNNTISGHLFESRLPNSDIPVYLVHQSQYFDREGIYNYNGEDYTDNCERFVFFSRAVLETIRLLNLDIDILHSNDWQTGLVPAYLEAIYRQVPGYEKIATIHTIHNLAYQGIFWHWDMLLTGLDWRYFNYEKMEFHGKLNLLKTGLTFAMGLTTVSPRYANEIQTQEFGCGLEDVLRYRRSFLTGITNGVDTERWNPENDEKIAVRYNHSDVFEKKPECKKALQEAVGLPVDPGVPVIGAVGRLAHQKGFDTVADILPHWGDTSQMQWVILGTGDPAVEQRLEEIAAKYPDKMAVRVEFSDTLARQIIAGSDLFLMPSRYEPCGLTQMYSMLYGTVPIVRETGGLADTVVDADPETIEQGSANGFTFQGESDDVLTATIGRALNCWYQERETWNRIVRNCMAKDWSWQNSARKYAEFYAQTLARLK